MNKNCFALKVCPWCKYTPELYLPLEEHCGGTWLWYIRCSSAVCEIHPETKKVAIRKSCKTDVERMLEKVTQLATLWNQGNPMNAFQAKVISFDNLPRGE